MSNKAIGILENVKGEFCEAIRQDIDEAIAELQDLESYLVDRKTSATMSQFSTKSECEAFREGIDVALNKLRG